MRRKGMFLILMLFISAYTVVAQPENLLQDSGFESADYRLVSRDPNDPGTTFNAPSGWWGGVVQPPGPESWRNAHANGFPHTAGTKIEGGRSFHMSRGGGTFTAYLYQQVNVVPGTDVEGGAWAYAENNGGSLIRLGIDPTGGTNPFSASVIWTPYSGTRYQWVQLSTRARAEGGVVTLFLFATQDAPSNPNGVYWDQAFLYGTRGQPVVTSSNPAPVISQEFVTANVRLRVRSGPGINFDQIGSLNRGDSAPVVGGADGWYAISTNGQTGYVYGQFVTVSQGQLPQNAAVSNSNSITLKFTVGYALRLRSAPTTSSETLARIPYTTIVDAIGRTADNNWILVRYGGQNGWVAVQYGLLNDSITRLAIQ